MADFKMPKIDILKPDMGLLQSSMNFADMGIPTKEVNGLIDDTLKKFDVKDSFDLSRYPNLKDKALGALRALPSMGQMSLTSFIPNSFFSQIDTTKIQSDLNSKLGTIDLGEFGTLKLPDDVGSMAKDLFSGKGIDFMSLYSMPAMETPSYNIDSAFNMDEMMAEVNTFSNLASDEFDVNQYINDFSDISF